MLQPVRPGNHRHAGRTPSLFVGRERELGEFRAAFEATLTGRGQTVVLSGEPGIGKTYMIEEFVASTASPDIGVYWGYGDEWEGTPAYWPWLQVLNALVSEMDADTLQSLRDVEVASLVHIVPGIAQWLHPSEEAPRLKGHEARFELFCAVVAVLRQAAVARPILLIIDDLHWADAASLELTLFIARALRDARVLLTVAYRQHEARPDTPLADALASLARVRGHVRLMLRGLSCIEVAAYVAHSMQDVPDQALTDAVFEATGGNALFMREVVRLLLAEGTLGQRGVTSRVPESVRDVVRQTVSAFAPGCRGQLGIASVIGREFSLTVLAGVAEYSVADVMSDIEPG
jgi:predicted ATPase